jgi:hypothetical protein
MTLKEKFIKSYRKVFSVENLAEEAEIIADEFAIGFAEWCSINSKYDLGIATSEELLEIYKKEKGLL